MALRTVVSRTVGASMKNIDEFLELWGKERQLAPDEVLIRQGAESDGAYYLKQGRLGVYREEQDGIYLLAEIAPGEIVGELGAATGRLRIATVKAEQASCVVHISSADFRRIMKEAPALVASVIGTLGDRLVNADVVRITLSRSYRQAKDRVQALDSQKAQLEELLRLREELADMIVHDLRNPIGVIANGLELLKQVSSGGTESEYVDQVTEAMEWSLQRMRRLLTTLLDIARLEVGETLNLQPLDLTGLIEEVMIEELPLAESSGVALEADLSESLPKVLGDRDFVERVLVNLLDNALKFASDKGRVWVEAHPELEAVRVEVIDTGPGVPVEDRERVFEKFTHTRIQVGTRKGLGLGLAFCQMAVEAHGGHIWIEDGPDGSGSRFIFTLPVAYG
jgi:signal transduction histidine kinase